MEAVQSQNDLLCVSNAFSIHLNLYLEKREFEAETFERHMLQIGDMHIVKEMVSDIEGRFKSEPWFMQVSVMILLLEN